MAKPRKTVKRATVSRDIHERVTALEVLMETQVKTSESLVTSVAEMKASLQKYQGFWGAVTLIGSAVWASFALFKDNLINLFTGK